MDFSTKDKAVVFDTESHSYTVNGTRLGLSVSGVVKAYWPEFNAASVAKRCGRTARIKWTGNPDATDAELVEAWDQNGKEASEKGTRIHYLIETYFLNPAQGSDLCPVVRRWLKRRFSAKGWRFWPEKIVYGTPNGALCVIPGTIDLLARDGDGQWWIFDWKRGEVDPDSKKGDIDEITGVRGTKYVKYSTQLALYAQILASDYDIIVPLERCRLVRTHEEMEPIEYAIFRGADGLASLAAALAPV